ncbi:MAG: hypothetical protein WAK60_03660 [Sedimentisphaerales bacterium]
MLTTDSVSQMIETLKRFMYKYSKTHNIATAQKEAIKEVSEIWRVGLADIHDLCTRRIGFVGSGSIDKFRNLLENFVLGDSEALKSIILKHSETQNRTEVAKFFEEHKSFVTEKSPVFGATPLKLRERIFAEVKETFSFQLEPDIAKMLKVLSVMKDASTSDWLADIVPKVVKQKYAEWLDKQNLKT